MKVDGGMLVDDPAVITELAPLYKECMERLFSTAYGPALEAANAAPKEGNHPKFLKMYRSAKHMGDHFAGYPLLLTAFSQGDRSGSLVVSSQRSFPSAVFMTSLRVSSVPVRMTCLSSAKCLRARSSE